MSFQKVTETSLEHKPKMKSAKDISELPSVKGYKNATVQVKADGEFNYMKYSKEGETFLLNRFGRKTTALPCLNEFKALMNLTNVSEAEVKAELYGYKDGKMLTLPEFIHYLKGGDPTLHQYLHLGIFEIISINGEQCNLIYPKKFEKLDLWTENGKLVKVLPYKEVTKDSEIEEMWNAKVANGSWEGLVVRLNGDTWKVKPNNGVDVAIIGINKFTKGFEEGKARSVKMALMNEDESFVEIGDCSGVGEEEASQLFKLTQLRKIGEDNNTVFVKPIVIATVEYITMYSNTKNRVFKITGDKISEVGEQTLVKLKSPHVVGYRADKKACVADIGLNQVNE